MRQNSNCDFFAVSLGQHNKRMQTLEEKNDNSIGHLCTFQLWCLFAMFLFFVADDVVVDDDNLPHISLSLCSTKNSHYIPSVNMRKAFWINSLCLYRSRAVEKKLSLKSRFFKKLCAICSLQNGIFIIWHFLSGQSCTLRTKEIHWTAARNIQTNVFSCTSKCCCCCFFFLFHILHSAFRWKYQIIVCGFSMQCREFCCRSIGIMEFVR